MIWLTAGASCRYDARFTVLDGAAALSAAETRIRANTAQPDDPYPTPSGNFRPLTGRPQI